MVHLTFFYVYVMSHHLDGAQFNVVSLAVSVFLPLYLFIYLIPILIKTENRPLDHYLDNLKKVKHFYSNSLPDNGTK